MSKLTRAAVAATILLQAACACAAESDVHFGLTKWLALQAGFTAQEAEALAIGDQRVESGDIQFMAESLQYACLTPDDDGWRRVQERHYPSAAQAPASPEQRVVAAGSDEAVRRVNTIMKQPAQQAGFLLGKLGEALNTLQDSWFNQGVSDIPQFGTDAIRCDPLRVWSHAKERGGWNSHQADLTYRWPADSLAMARATYDVLVRYPAVMNARRVAKPWSEIAPDVGRFVEADTKTRKKDWFIGHGIQDVSFLQGISLSDGKEPFMPVWQGRRVAPLNSAVSGQFGIESELLDFFNRFMSAWMASDQMDALVGEYGAGGGKPIEVKGKQPAAVTASAQLAAKLTLWRLRDHASAADLVHATAPLGRKELVRVAQLSQAAQAFAVYAKPAEAFIAEVPAGPEASVLLPFVTTRTTDSATGNPRAVAVVKLRHAPYDTVGVIAEKMDGRWRVIDLVSTIEH